MSDETTETPEEEYANAIDVKVDSIFSRAAASMSDEVILRMCAMVTASELQGVTHANAVEVAAKVHDFYVNGAPPKIRAVK